MIKQVTIFIWKNVGIWNKIKRVSPKLFLHFNIIEAHSILSCYFIGIWEMVYSLELIEALVEISFTTATGPKHIPLVRLCVTKAIGLAQASNQLSVALENLVEKLAVVDVISTSSALVTKCLCWRRIHQ
jgi:hypothetical protein